MTEVADLDEIETDDTDLSFQEENLDDMYLSFSVANEEYGIGIVFVTEILGMQRIMAVPDVPDHIRGVINLRGKVIPVMDVRMRFGLPWVAYDERTVIIVLEINNVLTGLVVSRVSEVLNIAPDQIEAPTGQHTNGEDIVSGLGKHDNRVCFLLDIPELLQQRLDDEDDIKASV